jgi:hypothetical protein
LDAISTVELACRTRPVSEERLEAEFDIARRQDPLDSAVARYARQGENLGSDIAQLLVLWRGTGSSSLARSPGRFRASFRIAKPRRKLRWTEHGRDDRSAEAYGFFR